MKDYQAVMLYIYPRLRKLEEDIVQLVEAKARASYAGKESAEACAQKMIDYLYARDRLAALREKLDGMLGSFTREERYMLEYKYFRRRKVLEGEFADIRCPFAERTYYRRQNRLAAKVNGAFMRRGMSEEWFMRTFSDMPFMMHALQSVRGGGAELADIRARGCLRVRRGNAL